jgi:hypothetical protein
LVAGLTGTAIRSSFLNPLSRPGVKWTDWANITVVLKESDQLGFTRQEQIDKAVEELTSDILEATVVSTPKGRQLGDPYPLYRPIFRIKYARRTR